MPGGLQSKLLLKTGLTVTPKLGQLTQGFVQLRFADSPQLEFHNLSASLFKTTSLIVRFFFLLSGISFIVTIASS